MKEHIFLHIDRTNQGDRGGASLLEFPTAVAAKEHIESWLQQSCGMDCYCGVEAETRLREEHGGELPETAFSCPVVQSAVDLEGYNGFYHYDSLGSF